MSTDSSPSGDHAGTTRLAKRNTPTRALSISPTCSTFGFAPLCTSAISRRAGFITLCYEVVDNSIDEAMAGHAKNVS